jgi:hypothetical protein
MVQIPLHQQEKWKVSNGHCVLRDEIQDDETEYHEFHHHEKQGRKRRRMKKVARKVPVGLPSSFRDFSFLHQ